MGLVTTWLSGIGLSHAIPTFKAAGIVTPSALAELDLAHYEALGVKDPADRRKLFYLVQRIKMAADHDDDEPDSAQETIEQVVSRTLSKKKSSSKQKLVLQEEDSIDDAEEIEVDDDDDEEEEEDYDDHEEEEEEDLSEEENMSYQRNSSRPSLNHGVKSTSIRISKGTVLSKKNRNSEMGVRENKTNKLGTKPSKSRNSSSAHATSLGISRTRSGRRIKKDENIMMDEMKENVSNESWGEEESLIADDELSSVGKSSAKRQSRRLQEKKLSSLESSSSAGEEEEDDEEEEEFTEDESKPRRTNGIRRKQSLSHGYTGDAETTKRRQSSSGRRSIKKSTSDRDADDESSEKRANNSRKSGMQPPRTRRFESKLKNPTRTGKRLSTIPSNSVAPQSPLVDLPVKKMEADIERNGGGRVLRLPSKHSGSTSGSDQECKPGRTRRRRSIDQKKVTSGSDTEVQNTRRRSVRMNSGGTSSKINRSSSVGRSYRKSIEPNSTLPSRGRKSLKKAAVLVHGTPEDNSWYGQVSRIREDNDSEHKLFSGNFEQNANDDEEMRIRVIVRKRPMSTGESKSSKEVDVIHPLDYDGYGRILVYQPKTRVDLTREIETIPFAYDNVFDESSSNQGIYEKTVRNIIPGVFEDGKWASVFAYGQTGSGKTFTMMGCNVTGIRSGMQVDNRANYGLYYMAAMDVFEMAEMEEFSHMSIGISLFEIYGGKLFDLLNRRNQIRCLEDSRGKVCFPGLSEHPVTCADEVMEIIEDGARARSTGTTSKNADSSRSHAILQIHVRKTVGRRANVEHGRLTFIDLAGSERGADTDKANRATRLEGAEINTSLLALKEVIRALATGDSMAHIPFRGSKLTQVLKESFVGENSCSVMVACVAPNLSNCEHTLNTLRYADRVKERNPEDGSLSASVVNISRASSIKRKNRLSLGQNENSMSMNENSMSMMTATDDDDEDDESFTLVSDDDLQETSAVSEDGLRVMQSHTSTLSDDDDLQIVSSHLSTSEREESEKEEEEEDDDENWTDYGDSVQNTPTKHDTRVIDELIAQSPEPSSPLAERKTNNNARDLIATHRECMAEMLTMCKEEMTLANSADGDRDNIDVYLSELSKIHERQCEMLAILHDKVSQFREDRDDESFEDLRE